MRSTVKGLYFFVLIFWAFIGTVFAENIFGPETYLRTRGWPNVYTAHFSSAVEEGVLRIYSGAPDGEGRVASAHVFLNWKNLARPDDFQEDRYLITEETIALAESNKLWIIMRGAPGSFMTIDITGQEGSQEGPLVRIDCMPDTIYAGQESLLSWVSANAEHVHINNGIGDVEFSGSLVVSPETTTTYIATATGANDTATDSVTLTVKPFANDIEITSPVDNDMVYGPAVMVQGILATPFEEEISVVVDGIAALVDGNRFAANHIPLEQGDNTIIAVATDSRGNAVETSVTVNAEINENSIVIAADPDIGISPFETTLLVDGTFPFIDPYVWGEGPGSVVISDGEEDDRFNVHLTDPGIYIFTAEAADDLGYVRTASVAVQVLSEAELDALLRDKWEDMASALADGNIEAAVQYFSGISRSMYQQRFAALSSVLDQVAGDMGPIDLVEAQGNFAVYDLTTERDGKIYSYQVVFVREEDGIWRIYNF